MATFGLSGLASGVDTSSIVDQLMALERQKVTRLALRESAVKARDAGLNDFKTKLKALDAATADLKASKLWSETQDVTNGDVTRLGALRTGPIAPGDYSVEVQRLATIEQRSYAYAGGAITIGDVDVTLAGDATASDAAAAINANADIGVTAAVVGGQLQLTSRTSGAAGAFTASGATLAEDGGKARAGQDAAYTINGAARTSSSNLVEDAAPGLRLTLKATTPADAPIEVTVGAPRYDVDKVADEVKGFITAYNALVDFIQAETTEARVKDPKTATDAAKGVLFGDRELVGARAALRNAVHDIVGGNPRHLDQLAEIGISTGDAVAAGPSEDAKLGRLVLDEDKLKEALELDIAGVQRLLGGTTGVDGFAQRLEKVISTHVDKLIPSRLESSSSELRRIADQMQRMDDRLAAKEERMRAQFAAMEKAMGLAQTQQAWLTGQIASLNAQTNQS